VTDELAYQKGEGDRTTLSGWRRKYYQLIFKEPNVKNATLEFFWKTEVVCIPHCELVMQRKTIWFKE